MAELYKHQLSLTLWPAWTEHHALVVWFAAGLIEFNVFKQLSRTAGNQKPKVADGDVKHTEMTH